MFGKTRADKRVPLSVVHSFEDSAIKFALTGKRVTLALSHFETHFTTNHEREHWHQATAVGYVHFGYSKKLLRARLKISETPIDLARGQIGFASFNYMDGEDPYAIFEVVVEDLRGKITRDLRAAFDSAAASQSRYLYVTFRREELEVETRLAEVREKSYGAHHPLLEMSFVRVTALQAPVSSWMWSK